MDSDEEVTREPFEQQQADEEESTSDVSSTVANYNQDPDHHPSEVNCSKDCRGGTALEEHVDSSSTADSEDANFAESYGVNLRAHKRKRAPSNSAYERLINSNQFLRESSEAEPVIETSVTSDCIYHKGTFYQKGDIVAVCDQDDGQIYFAQLTGFLQDQYCEKSASLYWLVPIRATSRELFDPSAYEIGLEDIQLRKLDCMTFVRHCPHDYYWRKFLESAVSDNSKECIESKQQQVNTRVNRKSKSNSDSSYIWTTMEPCAVPAITTRRE